MTLLESCGFCEVEVARHEGAWTFALQQATASIEQLLAVGPLGDAWATADDTTRSDAVDAVRSGCNDYRSDAGWRLPATALVVSASVRSDVSRRAAPD